MKALKIIGIVLLVLVGLFFIIGIFLPAKLQMEESIVINKPASLIFKQVNNFNNWQAWSPWQATDPDMVSTYEGPEQGVGAKTTWVSKKHGDGGMTIIENVPYTRLASTLEIGMEGATNSFDLVEENGATTVTWGVLMPKLAYPIERYVGLIMPGMMRPFFTDGLKKLKEVTEAMPDPPVLQLVQMPEKAVVSVIDSCNWSDIGEKMGQMFGKLIGYQKSAKFEIVGSPFSLYHKWDEVNQFTVFENFLPVDKEVKGRGNVMYKVLPETRAIMGTHYGAYEKTMNMYMAMDEFVKDFGLEMSSGPIEEYVTDPSMEPDTAKWQTNIYFPVK